MINFCFLIERNENMNLVEQLKQDLISAMKEKDKDKLNTLRSVKGALQLEIINNKKEENDDLVLDVINKQIKMRKDSIEEFMKAGRDDLVNSYQKEILIKDNTLFLRTGLSYVSYTLPNFNSIDKDSSYVLEEILNTYQTEEIVNLIKNYKPDVESALYNTVYSLNSETDSNYKSKSYYLEKSLLMPILDNRTFISTLNNLRITGDISDIEDWFNNITGDKSSYSLLIKYLKEIMELEKKYANQKLFKDITISRIKDLIGKVLEIINVFNKNYNYK